ncbi:MAG: FitA-like ribbon-helix-helix domain-containing protein [Holosporales bacterium]
MTALTLKNIPDKVYEALKAVARREHRSLNAQVIYCLEKVLFGPSESLSSQQRLDQLRALRPVIAPLTAENIKEAIDKGRL